MKTITLLISIVLEYFANKIEWFINRKTKPSHLAYSIETFTNETWIEGMFRQDRIFQYLYHDKKN